MAEAREEVTTALPQGKVQEVRRQFSVREDGALAYRIQNEEIEEHYGMNRQHRRTVRGDIPVAKVVQTEEEIEQQKERLRKLAALQAQAEADEIVARRVNRQVQDEVRRDEQIREIEDEELARQLQDREKAKYEKHLQKKRERKLRKEREKLEQQLARTTQEAGLALNPSPAASDSAVDHVSQDLGAMHVQGQTQQKANGVVRYSCRVTPGGRIEDDGDFSDFYAVPPNDLHPEEWEKVQQQQDEELARLLQEQEHKRSKAEVNKAKLREIEERDERLAAIMQEQEKLKEKKYKQKRQQQKELQRLQRQQSGEGLPLGATANMLSQMPITDHNHHLYRRNSYTKSIDNGPAPVDRYDDEYGDDGDDYVADPYAPSAVARTGWREGLASRGDPGRPQMPIPQNQAPPVHRTVIEVGNPPPNSNPYHPHPRTTNTQPSSRQQQQQQHQYHHQQHQQQQQRQQQQQQQQQQMDLSQEDASEVLRWLHTQGSSSGGGGGGGEPPAYESNARRRNHHPPSPTHDACDDEVSGLSRQAGFNIATAIDPTYHRRHTQSEEPQTTLVKTSVPASRSLPLADMTVSLEEGSDSWQDEGAQGPGGFQPVQGQRRTTTDSKARTKTRTPNASEPKGSGGSNSKNSNCKQQ